MTACPVCATESPDGARFCPSCGAALTAEARREERKVVTVLFADLVGFTARAEQLDPEEVRAVLAPYWERLRLELARRGGTVEKFIGDAVMALFGAPVAHDDDPLRAVGAALAIRDWAREEGDVQVRIAVNTGEALVLLGARPAEGEGMAAGDVVNTASRLQAAAPPNGVLVGETTYRATRDVVEYREHEPVLAKGKSDPLPVWEAVQVRSRLGMDVERATLPLVGRVRELNVIVEAFERAKSEREPQLVTLVGVPGIGKSRLVAEFFARLEQDPELVWWRQGRALPYGERVSYWALAEMVKAQAGIDENDDEQTATAKLRASVATYVDEDEREWVLDHLLPLVGAERAGSGEGVPAWRRYFEGLADARPLVAVFEDMHWADDGLLDFIDHLVEWATGVPLLVIATARPELLDRRPAWGGGKLNVSTIALTPLSDDEAARIIHGVLEEAALPAETQRALVERSGGNPLYAEQFARLYLERGSADDLPLPETVQGLIAARIDGLPADEKRLLQDAAVLGKVFWSGALSGDDVEQKLHDLERKGILRRERRSAVSGETQYAFRHVLVRDVAYGQIPRALRGEKHVRAADWIDSLGRADDHAELVAHHLGAAHALGTADDVRTRIAFRRAGRRADALGASDVAATHYARALELWPEPDPERARLLAAHARSTFRATSDRARFANALEELERHGLFEEAGELAAIAANAAWVSSDVDAASQLLERGRRLLDGRQPSPALAAVLTESARLVAFTGQADVAERELTAALELAARFGREDLRATLLVTRGVLRLNEGELEDGRKAFDAVIAQNPPASPAGLRARLNRAAIEYFDGDMAAFSAYAAQTVEPASRAGDRQTLRWVTGQQIYAASVLGQWDEALRRADDFLRAGRHYTDNSIVLVRAQILAARGQVDEARSVRDSALADFGDSAEYQRAIATRMVSAWVSFLCDDDALGGDLIDGALALLERSGGRAPGLEAGAAASVVRAGREAAWLAYLARAADTRRCRATRLFLEHRWTEAADGWARVSPHDEAIARIEAGRELFETGRRREGDLQLQRGLAFFRAVGATKVVRDAERLLTAAAAAE